jgi:hypothetical protein
MVIVIPTVTSDETHKHLPQTTDLPLALVFIAIYVLGLTFYVMFVPRSHELGGNIC